MNQNKAIRKIIKKPAKGFFQAVALTMALISASGAVTMYSPGARAGILDSIGEWFKNLMDEVQKSLREAQNAYGWGQFFDSVGLSGAAQGQYEQAAAKLIGAGANLEQALTSRAQLSNDELGRAVDLLIQANDLQNKVDSARGRGASPGQMDVF